MEFEPFSALKSSSAASSSGEQLGTTSGIKDLDPPSSLSPLDPPQGEKLGLSGLIPSSSSLLDCGAVSLVKSEAESSSFGEKMGSPTMQEPAFLFSGSELDSSSSTFVQGQSITVPQPLACLQSTPIPPFLSKTYDLIDDPSLDPIISWSSSGESFVVWDPMEFTRSVLPRHFKHSNFSSFVRQLNTYVGIAKTQPTSADGFRKIDAERWEFASEAFLRGKKYLLKYIHRRKSHQMLQIGHSAGLSIEVAMSGLQSEAEKLRKDKSVLLKDARKLQQEHLMTVTRMERVNQRLHSAEQRQKQMVSFLAKVLQNPVFLAHLHQQDQHELGAKRVKRKFLKQKQVGPRKMGSPMEVQIVKYKPSRGEAAVSTMKLQDMDPETGKQLPEYPLQDMICSLGLDSVTGAQAQAADVAPEELHKESAEASKQIEVQPGLPTMGTSDILFKGKDVLSSAMDVSSSASKFFVSFPDDLSQEKIPSIFTTFVTESICKQEDLWSMGLHAGASQPSASHDVWENILSYDGQELAVAAGLSDFRDLESHQPEEGSEIDRWTTDEISFDDLETQLVQLEEAPSGKMDP
ncbi:Heat Stress Transcription Factor [Asimina triloba]